jgi:hypothetical protein
MSKIARTLVILAKAHVLSGGRWWDSSGGDSYRGAVRFGGGAIVTHDPDDITLLAARHPNVSVISV